MPGSSNILLVRVPDQAAVDGRELRDYILESLAQGVLVLTEDASCEVMELPSLGGVETGEDKAPQVQEPPVETSSAQKKAVFGGPGASEKRRIMDRLKAYRLAHGLGCWTAVAKASGGKLSEDQLRDMAAGSVALPIREWRLADKALDKLERKEAIVADG